MAPPSEFGPEQRSRAAEQLHPLHVFHREQIEVHLGCVGLVLAYSVEEHRHSRGQSNHRADVEAPGAEIELERRAKIVVQRNPGLGREGIGQQPRFPGIDRCAGYGRDPGGNSRANGGSRGRGDGAGHLDRLQLGDSGCVGTGGVGSRCVRLLGIPRRWKRQQDERNDQERAGESHEEKPSERCTGGLWNEARQRLTAFPRPLPVGFGWPPAIPLFFP